jgi:hypothetical protein
MEQLTVFISPQLVPTEIAPLQRPSNEKSLSFNFWLEQAKYKDAQPHTLKNAPQDTKLSLHIPVKTPLYSSNPVFQAPLQRINIPLKQQLPPQTHTQPTIQTVEQPPKADLAPLQVNAIGLLVFEVQPATALQVPPPQQNQTPSQVSTNAPEDLLQTVPFWAHLAAEALEHQRNPVNYTSQAATTPFLDFTTQETPAPQAGASTLIGAIEINETKQSGTAEQKSAKSVPVLAFSSAFSLKLQISHNYQLHFFIAQRTSTHTEKSEKAATEGIENPESTPQIGLSISPSSQETKTTALNAESEPQTQNEVISAIAPHAQPSNSQNEDQQEDNNGTENQQTTQQPILSFGQQTILPNDAPETNTETHQEVGAIAAAPAPSAPVASAPAPTTPVASAPAPSAPVASAPAPTTPVASAPAPSAPVASAPAPTTPVASAPAPSAPVASAPAPSAPVASAPVPSAPVASAPAPTTPVASAPAPSAPVASAPAPSTPVASAPVPSTPVASAPAPSAPVASAPAPTTPVASAPAPTTPVASAPAPTTPVASAPAPTTPVASAPAPTTPVASAPVPSAPVPSAPVATTPAPVVQETAPASIATSDLMVGNLRIRILLLAEQGVPFADSKKTNSPQPTSEANQAVAVETAVKNTSQTPISVSIAPEAKTTESSVKNQMSPQNLELVTANLGASFLSFKNDAGSNPQQGFKQKPQQIAPLEFQAWSHGELSIAAMDSAQKPVLFALSPEKPWWLDFAETSESDPATELLSQINEANPADGEESDFPWESLFKPLLQASTAPITTQIKQPVAPLLQFATIPNSVPPIAKVNPDTPQEENVSPLNKPAEAETVLPMAQQFTVQPEIQPTIHLPFIKPTPQRSAGLGLGWSNLESNGLGLKFAPVESGLAKPETIQPDNQQPVQNTKAQNTETASRANGNFEAPDKKVIHQKAETQPKSQTATPERASMANTAMSVQTAIQLHNQGVPIQISDFPAFVNEVLQTRNFKVGALQSIEVALNPQNLGTVNAHFILKEHSEMIVRLYAPNAMAAKMLESHVQEIQQMIQKSYLVVGQIEIKQGIPPARGAQGGNASGQNSEFSSRQSSRRSNSSRRRKQDDDLSVDVTV